MAKFCGKCGAKLDEKTGLCPNCDKQALQTTVLQDHSDMTNGIITAKVTAKEQAPIAASSEAVGRQTEELKEKKSKGCLPKILLLLLLVMLLFGVLIAAISYYGVTNVSFALNDGETISFDIDVPDFLKKLIPENVRSAKETKADDSVKTVAENDKSIALSLPLDGIVVQPDILFSGSTVYQVKNVSASQEDLDLRTGPGPNYDITGEMPYGAVGTALGKSSSYNGWILVLYEDRFAWAYSSENGATFLEPVD